RTRPRPPAHAGMAQAARMAFPVGAAGSRAAGMNDHVYLRPGDLDKLAELVFELAQQLHVERARRIALEQALIARGVVTPTVIEEMAAAPAACEPAREQLDRSLERLLRILDASGGPEAPMR